MITNPCSCKDWGVNYPSLVLTGGWWYTCHLQRLGIVCVKVILPGYLNSHVSSVHLKLCYVQQWALISFQQDGGSHLTESRSLEVGCMQSAKCSLHCCEPVYSGVCVALQLGYGEWLMIAGISFHEFAAFVMLWRATAHCWLILFISPGGGPCFHI